MALGTVVGEISALGVGDPFLLHVVQRNDKVPFPYYQATFFFKKQKKMKKPIL